MLTTQKKGEFDIIDIPPKIRALAKVVHDADDVIFADLRDSEGKLRDEPLVRLINQLGYDIDDREKKQFELAYDEYGLQLMGIDLSVIAKSRVSEALKLTTAIDSEATLAGISLAHSFDAIGYAHAFLIKNIAVELPGAFQKVFNLLMNSITGSLQEALVLVKFRVDQRRGAVNKETQRKLATHNAQVWFAVQHLEWFMEACKFGIFYDAGKYLTDIAALKVWNKYVGKHTSACPTEDFEPALVAFPNWAHEALKKALNYLDEGVVSVFTLQRVLKLWGPFSLLDRNLRSDLSRCFISLTKPTEVVALDLTDPVTPGAFCVTFGRTTGNLVLQFVSHDGKLRTVPLTRETGCWTLPGLSNEDCETVADACASIPDTLVTPAGEDFGVPPYLEEEKGESFSILHRACFQNNVAYVRRLLDCGGSLLVNSAEKDPGITPDYSWTPLLCAVNNPTTDPEEVTSLLIAHGADITFTDVSSSTALYYAIVNGYHRTVRLLLKHNPNLKASQSSVPLILAMGANLFNVREQDNRRTSALVPSPKVVAELLLYIRDPKLIHCCIALIQGKIKGVVVEPPADWDYFGLEVPLATEVQHEANRGVVEEHKETARRMEYRNSLSEVLRLLQMHSFFLSCQSLDTL